MQRANPPSQPGLNESSVTGKVFRRLLILAFAAFAASCGPQGSSESHFGSNKAFLSVCEEGVCESGDSCACGVCTIPCEENQDCVQRILGVGRSADEIPNIVCRVPLCASGQDEAEMMEEGQGLCEVTCEQDDDCNILSEKDEATNHFCNAGVCRTLDEPDDPAAQPPEALESLCPPGRSLIPTEATPGDLGLCLDDSEVTVAEYRVCVESGDCEEPDAGNYLTSDREDHPVQFVDAMLAETYCASIQARLPTEEEWRSATQGSDDYPWGGNEPTVDDVPQLVCGLSATTTCPVESFPLGAGPYGHHDLSGNVAEIVLTDDEPCVIGGGFDDDAANLALNNCVALGPPAAATGFRCISDL